MRIPTSSQRTTIKFDITPMIDVVFNLIIFFLVAAIFVDHDTTTPVDLPLATTTEDTEAAPRRFVVTVTADHEYKLNDALQSFSELEQKLLLSAREKPEEFELRIRTDRTVPYRHIEPLLQSAARAGITQIKFAVLPR